MADTGWFEPIVKKGLGKVAETLGSEGVKKVLKDPNTINTAKNIAAETAAAATGVGNKDLWGKAFGLAKNYADTVGAPVREEVLNYLTTTAKDAGRGGEGFKSYAPTADPDRVPRFRSERSVGDPYEVKKGEQSQGWNQRWTKEPGDYRPDWVTEDSPIDKVMGAVYENPAKVADVAGTATAAGGAILGGTALNWWAQGEKPRSSYASNVEPYRGGFNSSVESAEASAFYKHQLEEQKFAHKMELMQAREQARTPGIQNTSMGAYGGGAVDNSSTLGLLKSQFGNTRQYL
jgi:hypothetical protein